MHIEQRITTMDDLKREKYRVIQRLEMHQKDLQHKIHQVPAELAAAGVNAAIPSFLRGKVTNAALNGGKKLINSLMAPGDNTGIPGKVSKGLSLLSVIKTGIRLFRGK